MPAAGNNILGLVELAASETTDIRDLNAEEILQQVFNNRLKNWIRAKDEIHGLDENRACVILTNISSRGELDLAAAKLDRIFREPHYHMGRMMPMKVVAGFTEMDHGEKDMVLAMQHANVALSQAKESSDLFKIYSPEQARSIEEQGKLLTDMERALELGEFQLYYQPKVHAGYRTLVGAEALIRWHTKDRKIIGPDKFIDLAEQNEIIRPMTWWAIKSAICRLQRWPEELSIAVNICPALLLGDDILSVVADALDLYGVNPSRLNLEVTEKIMIENQGMMLGQLSRLRDTGVKISIDDFGTGFSSLAYFRDLPVDEIKIDQSFVGHMLESKKDYAIVKAVIDLAHNFSLKVVAEGVESVAIADRLTEMRCDILQGYVFDKPLRIEEFEIEYRI